MAGYDGKKRWNRPPGNGVMGWIYFLTIIGVAVYYIEKAQSFWPGVLGVLKAFVWPAILIYEVFSKVLG